MRPMQINGNPKSFTHARGWTGMGAVLRWNGYVTLINNTVAFNWSIELVLTSLSVSSLM